MTTFLVDDITWLCGDTIFLFKELQIWPSCRGSQRESTALNLTLKHYLFELLAFFPLVFFAEVSFCSEIPRCREPDESLSTHHQQP